MDDRLCLSVITGVTEHGRKELVAVEDGYRESEASWSESLLGLRDGERGLILSPKLAVGDGAGSGKHWPGAIPIPAISAAGCTRQPTS